jgi:hypothetical protein
LSMQGQFLAYFPYFEENEVGLWDHHAVCVPSLNFWMAEPIFMAPEPISTEYFINPSH